MIKRILVALSGTPYTPVAIQHAIDLAKRHKASITGVTVADLPHLANVGPVPAGGGAAAADLVDYRINVTEERIAESIKKCEQAAADAGIHIPVIRETGDPFEQLTDLWRYHDLTIIGLRGLFEYGVLQHPQDYVTTLVHKGIRPILAVGDRFRTIDRVLITYNGSVESAKTMKRFVQLQAWGKMTVQIACWHKDEGVAGQLLHDAHNYCLEWGVETETRHLTGDPRDELIGHAQEWNADLIVLGATNRRRIFKYVLGDTAVEAIENSPIPLFLSQ